MENTRNRLSQHEVKNMVISCIDFRFNADLRGAIARDLGVTDFDELKLAGGAGNLALLGETRDIENSNVDNNRRKTVLEDVGLAVNAHHVTDIYLLTHQNCGAYGMAGHSFPKELGVDEENFHAGELAHARQTIANHFPDVVVHTGFISVLADNSLAIKTK